MKRMPFRESVRILFHTSGAFTKILLERCGVDWDFPTDLIPIHLRHIGTRCLLAGHHILPEDGDTPDGVREALRSVRVEEL